MKYNAVGQGGNMDVKLKSRKFWFAIAGAVCSIGAAAFGSIEWSQAIQIVLAFLGGYIGIEGIADAIGRIKE